MPTSVPTGDAGADAAERAARTATVLAPLWRASKLWTAAVALGLFPFLFIIDRLVEIALSPVLPGLALLLLLILGLPFLLVELSAKRSFALSGLAARTDRTVASARASMRTRLVDASH